MDHSALRFIFLKHSSERNEDLKEQEWMPVYEVTALVKAKTD